MEELMKELKVKIVETLNFEELTPDAIQEDAPLVGGELGIDSIDILELVMMLEKEYSILIDSKELGAQVFSSLRSLADYVDKHIKATSN